MGDGQGLRENEVRVTAVPVNYLRAIRVALGLVVTAVLAVLVATILVLQTVQRTLEEQRAEQELDNHQQAEHICLAALDHLDSRLDLRAIADQVGLDTRRINTRLDPEVVDVCRIVDKGHPE